MEFDQIMLVCRLLASVGRAGENLIGLLLTVVPQPFSQFHHEQNILPVFEHRLM